MPKLLYFSFHLAISFWKEGCPRSKVGVLTNADNHFYMNSSYAMEISVYYHALFSL